MWMLWFWAVLVSVLLGLSIKLLFSELRITNDVTAPFGDRRMFQISWVEFAIVLVLSVVIVIPVTTKIGYAMAKNSKLTYKEFWGGYEVAALKTSRECHRDGSCSDTYDCDGYLVPISTGKTTTFVTEYHHCPVATVENDYTIQTTLGNYNLGYAFDSPAQAYRSGKGLDSTPQGDPTLWTDARQRIDSGNPGPVTAVRPYDNYVLASSQTILHKFSDAITKYQAANLLPGPVTNVKSPIHDYYYADKIQFVGMPAPEPAGAVSYGPAGPWNFALGQLNAAVGTDLQGDVHVVVIDSSKVTDPDDYAGALNAYWQSPALGKNALSKNGIGIVLGVSAGNITWARAFTGMPVGNDAVDQDLVTNLTGQPFTPAIFGHPKGTITDGKDSKGKPEKIVKVTTTGSPIERALWGPHKFVRVSMGHGGSSYKYLGNEIQPSSGQKTLIILVSTLFVLLFWAIALFTTIGEKSND